MTTVRTAAGAVRGFVDEGISVFLGVPYAAPPVGDLRFIAPAPAERWDGVRDALAYGPTAPQRDPVATIIPEPVEHGDDYLNLNIYTPDPGARLPVFVWIHGGGFVSGCNRSPWYWGTPFARDGVVVVTVGYRLGIEGFVELEDAPPNRAVLDWVAALRWVQENIAAFGGDPSRVTVGGQSAGSAACLILMADERNRGLFRRVIAMSGTSDTRMPRERGIELGEKIAAHLGVGRLREDFARFTPDDLIDAHAAVGANPFTADAIGSSFDPRLPALKPSVDGDVIPEHTFRAIRNGVGREIDLLAGATAQEVNGVIRMQSLDDASARTALAAMGLEGERLARYTAHVGGDLTACFAQAATDRAFRAPLAGLLEDRVGSRTFGYEFRWPSPAFGGLAGAAHCLDVPFAWDNLDSERSTMDLLGDAPPQALADDMHTAWVRFITDGDPGWPVYDAGSRTMRLFDVPSSDASDPLELERELFVRA